MEFAELEDQPESIPAHVAIIMDGNGRWAQARGLPRIAGHRAGTENIRRVVEGCVELGISYLTLYAFSTENWRRPRDEVDGLLSILGEVIERETPKLHENGVQLRHIGHLEGLPPDLRRAVTWAMDLTHANERLILNVAYNYGGRAEIVHAIRRMLDDGLRAEDVTEELVGRYLFTRDSPDPDLIIRTAGEWRLSNFLIWQAAYSEYWSTPTPWPEFGKQELRLAVCDYARRLRKFGALVDVVD